VVLTIAPRLQYGAYLNPIINRPRASLIAEHGLHHQAAIDADIARSFRFLLPAG
jgi:hypothetical protein